MKGQNSRLNLYTIYIFNLYGLNIYFYLFKNISTIKLVLVIFSLNLLNIKKKIVFFFCWSGEGDTYNLISVQCIKIRFDIEIYNI
jgi:hypothetical protein